MPGWTLSCVRRVRDAGILLRVGPPRGKGGGGADGPGPELWDRRPARGRRTRPCAARVGCWEPSATSGPPGCGVWECRRKGGAPSRSGCRGRVSHWPGGTRRHACVVVHWVTVIGSTCGAAPDRPRGAIGRGVTHGRFALNPSVCTPRLAIRRYARWLTLACAGPGHKCR